MPPYGMYTLTTVIFIWIAICLLHGETQAYDTTGFQPLHYLNKGHEETSFDEDKSTPPKPSNQVVTDSPSPSSVQVPLSEDTPDFRLTNKKGEVCLRAVFHATFVIQYMTKGLPKTRMLTAEVEVPSQKGTTSVSGECGEKNSTLDVSWLHLNSTFSLKLVFEKMDVKSSFSLGDIPSWAVTAIALTFDTRKNSTFPKIVSTDSRIVATTGSDKQYFSTPANFSYACDSQEDITLQVYKNQTADESVVKTITMSVWGARIQGFAPKPAGNFSLAVSCETDQEIALPHRNTVPIVVAAGLGSVIGIIVIVYFFVKNRTQTYYSSMD